MNVLRRSARLLRPLLDGIAAAVLVVAMLLAVVPFAPVFPTVVADGAWPLALSQAVADRLVFGRDVVFNLGPYGAVYTAHYHPATGGFMLAGTGLVAVAVAAGLAAVTRGPRRWLALLVPGVVALDVLRDPVFMVTPLLLLAVASHSARRGAAGRGLGGDLALVLLTAATALLTLVKGTFGALALPMILLAASVLAVSGRRAVGMGLLGLAVLTVAIAWLAVGQDLAALPGYFASFPSVIGGYTEGGALSGAWNEVVGYVAGSLLLLALLTWDRRPVRAPSPPRAALLAHASLLAGTALTLFLAFKSGFVRHDTHALIAVGTLALAALVLMGELRPRGIAEILVVAATVLTFVGGQHTPDRALVVQDAVARMRASATQAWERVVDPGVMRRRYEARMAAIRAAWPLPQVEGPTDIYSTGQATVIAHGLDWSPRPSLQSTTAFTGAVARADLAHLQGEGGRPPVRNVFFRVEYDDNRLRAIEDGLSWPALLSAFSIEGFDPAHDVLRLERRPGVASAEPDAAPLLTGRFRRGHDVALPEGGGRVLWARLDIRPTLLGMLFKAAFKPPILHLEYRYADGRTDAYRLLSSLAEAGFVIAPVVTSTTDFLWLTQPERSPRPWPISIRVVGERGTHWLWRSAYDLTIQALPLPTQPDARRLVPG